LGYTNTALSIILLLDQVSRNRFRTKETLPYVYTHYDSLSQFILSRVFARKPRPDLHPSIQFSPAYRVWFYMPLMHSEKLEQHDQALQYSDEMSSDVASKGDEEAVKFIEMQRKFEMEHRDIIAKFGHYPYRNEYVGRQTTKEEEEWLKTGQTFGVAK